jgi:hypothetical protein
MVHSRDAEHAERMPDRQGGFTELHPVMIKRFAFYVSIAIEFLCALRVSAVN